MTRRSKHTHYTEENTQIYEYKNQYYLLEECQQGQVLNPAHGTEQSAGDFAAVSSVLPATYGEEEIGKATLKALQDYDRQAHPFDQFDIPARSKVISGWFGARGMGVLEKNCRIVQVIRNLDGASRDYPTLKNGSIIIIPWDNNILQPYHAPMNNELITLPSTATATDIGAAIKKAFEISTYHPQRKDPKVVL
jgi:hypothetical protein